MQIIEIIVGQFSHAQIQTSLYFFWQTVSRRRNVLKFNKQRQAIRTIFHIQDKLLKGNFFCLTNVFSYIFLLHF